MIRYSTVIYFKPIKQFVMVPKSRGEQLGREACRCKGKVYNQIVLSMADLTILHLTGKKDENLTDLLEMKQKLDCELRILEIAKSADDEVNDGTSVEDMNARISELSEDLMEESTKVSWKNLFIKRTESSRNNENLLETKDSSLVATSYEDLELASEIMRILKEISTLEKTHASEQRVNLDLKQDNMALIQKLKDHKVKESSISLEVKAHPEYKKLNAELEIKTMSVDINKNLLMQMIMGAGMDRDSDDCLQYIISHGEIV